MAERRMFAKTIIDSDAFLDMPLSTQALYFHLSMRADDDGFLNNAKKIQRMIGCSDDDLRLLFAKNFVIPFESGVVVIKHWKIHNYIRSDRYKATVYTEEKELLQTKENGAYTLGIPNVYQLGYQMDTQDRRGKDSTDKDNIHCPAEAEPHPDYKEIIDYLNEATGASFKATTKKTVSLIKARFNEGFTTDDFKTVISKKVSEWTGTEMQKYLRPETLFGTKFEGYLNQQSSKGYLERSESMDDVLMDL